VADKPTEPLSPETNPVYFPPPEPARRPTVESALGPFSHTEFRFTTGLRASEVAPIRGAGDEVLLTYRSFASIVGVIAALVAGIVAVAGLASVLFLYKQEAPVRALIALALTLAFSFLIAMLSPRVGVTLYDGAQPALAISQRSLFPSAVYTVTAPNGAELGELRKSFLSRLGRNGWSILQNGRHVGEAREASLAGALVRKFLGKFSRTFETDIVVTHGGMEAGRILRRRNAAGRMDVLEVVSDAMDRRLMVAVATLILGREP
jgi:hypothetical protein